jgi:predicted Ser/Thr protein kinase
VVFKARQRSLNRVVAVKMILSGAFATPAEVERFRIEAEAAARLKHPGIVGIHEVGQHQGLHYFSMDYVEGPNLAERVAQNGALPPIDAARLIQQVAEALAYAHGQGTLHRDLKPQNIVIYPKGNAHIADFGLAKITNVQKDITRTGTVLGTPAYMPPEQAAGRWNEVGPQSDIYALGAVLYFAITGRPPFTADEPVSLLRNVLEQLPEAPRRDNPLIPLELENICLRALEKEARRRYASAQEFADDLGRFVRGEPVLARRPGAALRVWGWCQRHSWLGKALLAIAFLALASVAYGLWEKTQFLAWLNKYPDFKQDPVGAEKELRKVVDGLSILIFIPMLFLDYSKRHYATLVRKRRYALVLYVYGAIGTALFCHGLWAMSLSIKAHVWHGVPLGLNIWCSLLAASWGPIAWMMMFKELRLLRLGQTPEKGLSADEYQELVNLQWSLSKERTQELVREALIRGDREKAETVDRYGRLGMSLEKFEEQLRAEGVLKGVDAAPPPAEFRARRQANRKRLIGAVMTVMFLGFGIVFYYGEESQAIKGLNNNMALDQEA